MYTLKDVTPVNNFTKKIGIKWDSSKTGASFHKMSVNSTEAEDIKMQKFTDLHVDSVLHRPSPKTAITGPNRVSVILCRPLFEIINKP